MLKISLDSAEAVLDLHVLGNPVHHFFGVFGDYLTKNVLRVNSAVVSSKRLDIGGSSSTSISPAVLTHYEYIQTDRIKSSIKATKKYCRVKAQILTKQIQPPGPSYIYFP